MADGFSMSLLAGTPVPETARPGDAGFDLRAREAVLIPAGGRALVPTGVRVSLPADRVAYVCSRSGLALHHGIAVLNAPGVVDSNYRGEVGVILRNESGEDYRVEPGDRIAQLVVQRVELPDWEVVEELESSVRGDGGFGSSGRG